MVWVGDYSRANCSQCIHSLCILGSPLQACQESSNLAVFLLPSLQLPVLPMHTCLTPGCGLAHSWWQVVHSCGTTLLLIHCGKEYCLFILIFVLVISPVQFFDHLHVQYAKTRSDQNLWGKRGTEQRWLCGRAGYYTTVCVWL